MSYSLGVYPSVLFSLRNTFRSASVEPKLVPVIVIVPFKIGEAD